MAKTPEIDSRRNQGKNYLINGGMRFCQRSPGGTFVSVADNTYTLDRMLYRKVGAAVQDITHSTNPPSVAESGYLFQNSMLVAVTTADNSLAAGDFVAIQQKIEGYNWNSIAQKAFTLSFWVKANLIGVYCVGFTNSGSNRSYVAEYTVNALNTWEYKTITVSASPSAGTWDYSNGEGLRVQWALASGTTFQTTANTWQTGNFFATVNQVNAVATIGNQFSLTGIQINEGTSAVPFRLFGGGSVETELAACQRYYEKTYSQANAPASITSTGAIGGRSESNNNTHIQGRFIVPKRAVPSIVIYNPVTGATGTFREDAGADRTPTVGNIGENGFTSTFTAASSTGLLGHFTATAEL